MANGDLTSLQRLIRPEKENIQYIVFLVSDCVQCSLFRLNSTPLFILLLGQHNDHLATYYIYLVFEDCNDTITKLTRRLYIGYYKILIPAYNNNF